MKHHSFFLFILAFLLSITVMARPVSHGVYALAQPDGSIFHARFHGDEFMRIKTDMSGRAIMQDKEGWWCYASYLEDGTKSCEKCQIPHKRENYGRIVERYADIAELAKKK